MSPRAQKWTLATVLLALAALFAVWFAHDRH